MSDILIRGMEMPKNCEECDFAIVEDVDFDYSLYCKCSKKYCDLDALWHPIGWNCPLVEVPPHSDLVDRNKLLEKAHYDYNEATHDYNKFRVVFEDDIIDAPVIIEGNIDGRK